MSKLIIVCGLPGSGKTTLAKELSRKLKTACIHKDSIKERLYESLKYSTLEESKHIGKPSVDVMFHLAEEQMMNDVDVIIESPFNFPEDYSLFDGWQEKYKVELFSIICFIGKDEREKRFRNRPRHDSHHDELRVDDHFATNEEYDYATIPGKHILINTNESLQSSLERVIKKIG